jgi:hypothetical protein
MLAPRPLDLPALGRLRRAFCRSVWLRLVGRLGLLDFVISSPGELFYDFASWRGFLIRDNQPTIRSLVNVIVLGLALCNHSETEKQ